MGSRIVNDHGQLVQGDAAALPFADGTFETVVAMWVSTDVDDLRAVLHEHSPWWSGAGVRDRVSMRHVPLAEFFNAVSMLACTSLR